MKKVRIATCMGIALLVSNASFGALIAKFDGTQIALTNGNQVATWVNQGTGLDANGLADVSYFPTATSMVMPNGTTRTVVDFDGVNDHLTMGSDPANYDGNSFTWIMVFKNGDTAQNGKALLSSTYEYTYGGTVTSGNNPVWQTFANSDNNIYVAARSDTGGFAGKSSGAGTSDEWHIMTGKWDGSNRLYAYLDGNYLGYTSSATADPTGHVRTRIGSNSNGTAGSFFNGQIAEIQIYNEVLDDTARTAIEDDLANTYIIPEPATLGLVGLFGAAIVFVRKFFA